MLLVITCFVSSLELDKTAMTPGRDQEPVVHLHHLISHALTQPSTPTFSKEERSRKAKLHPRKVETDAHSRAASKRHVYCLLLWRHILLVHEPKTVEPKWLGHPSV